VGAQPVTIQLAELPQALATGGIDNFLTSSASGVESKLHEQVKFFYDVNAWLPRNAVVVNARAFDALDAATQAAVLRVAAAAGDRGWQLSEQKDDEYLKDRAAVIALTMIGTLMVVAFAAVKFAYKGRSK